MLNYLSNFGLNAKEYIQYAPLIFVHKKTYPDSVMKICTEFKIYIHIFLMLFVRNSLLFHF